MFEILKYNLKNVRSLWFFLTQLQQKEKNEKQ